MKSLKLFLNFLAAACLLLQTSMVNAEPFVMEDSDIRHLNAVLTVDNMERLLKDQFTTAEDHRVITYEFVKLRKLAKKWIWRMERSGKGLAFRVNGKVQFHMTIDPENSDVLSINGKDLAITKGMSFLTFYKKFEKEVISSKANFDALFMNEADAALWPFLMLFLGGSFGANRSIPDPNKTPQAIQAHNYRPNCNPRHTFYYGVNPRLNSNFAWKSAQHFRAACEVREPDGCKYQEYIFEDAAGCIAHKMKDRVRYANGATPQDIARLCNSVYQQVLACRGGGTTTTITRRRTIVTPLPPSRLELEPCPKPGRDPEGYKACMDRQNPLTLTPAPKPGASGVLEVEVGTQNPRGTVNQKAREAGVRPPESSR